MGLLDSDSDSADLEDSDSDSEISDGDVVQRQKARLLAVRRAQAQRSHIERETP